jgi:hypothetical protein
MLDFFLSLLAWFDAWFHLLATCPLLFLFLIGTWVRYADFEREGLFKSRQQLKNAIDNFGFPPGRLISPNVRAWHKEREVAPWLKAVRSIRSQRRVRLVVRGNTHKKSDRTDCASAARKVSRAKSRIPLNHFRCTAQPVGLFKQRKGP